MEFEWDEAKRQEVLATRDVDMVFAALIFRGPVLTDIDTRRDYGEQRLKSVGMVSDDCFVVVYTRRGEIFRLITAWRGGRDDKKRYQAGVS